MAWFHFSDMHSGGDAQTEYEEIYIEAHDREMAIDMFDAYFGFSPLGTTCECCGRDYSIYEEETDVEPARCAGVLVVSLADVLSA